MKQSFSTMRFLTCSEANSSKYKIYLFLYYFKKLASNGTRISIKL